MKQHNELFNPTMVRLQLLITIHSSGVRAVFSIPLWCDCNMRDTTTPSPLRRLFNPTMVRLQPKTKPKGVGAMKRIFNPTMVRLQQFSELRKKVVEASFSIPLWCDCNHNSESCPHPPPFSIPLWCDCNGVNPCVACVLCVLFNPTMVRLQPPSRGVDPRPAPSFQSHYGAIATKPRNL